MAGSLTVAKHNDDEVLTVKGVTLAEFTRDWEKYGDQLNRFVKALRSLNHAVVQAGLDLAAKRGELAAAKADLERVKKECEVRLAGANTSHQNLVNDITKERIEIAAEKRRLEFMAAELNRKAVGV